MGNLNDNIPDALMIPTKKIKLPKEIPDKQNIKPI